MFQLPCPLGFKVAAAKWTHEDPQVSALCCKGGERSWIAQKRLGYSWMYVQGSFSMAKTAFLVLAAIQKEPHKGGVSAAFKYCMSSRTGAARSYLWEPRRCMGYLKVKRILFKYGKLQELACIS